MAPPQRSYEDFIEVRSRTNPCISGLAQYVRQSPLLFGNSKFVLVDYAAIGGGPPDSREITEAELSQLQMSPSHSTPRPQHQQRVLLVENIRPQALLLLGEALDVDPVFFASHVKTDFQDIENAPPPPSLALPPSQLAQRGFLHIHYQQVIDLGCSTAFNTSSYILKTDSNAPRNVRRLPPLSGRQLGLARGCCSMLLLSWPPGSWICLVLVDPPVNAVVESLKEGGTTKHSSKPLHGGFEDFTQPETFSSFKLATKDADGGLRDPLYRGSMFGSLVHYFVNYHRPQEFSAGMIPEPLSVLSTSYYPIRIALAEWVLYANLTSRYVKLYEYSLRDVHNRLHDNDIIDLQRWRRRCKQSQNKLDLLAEFVRQWLPENQQEQGRAWDLVLRDIGFVQSQIRDHSHSLEQMIPVATSMVQLLDSRRSIAQSANITRLTYFALVFVPLSWVASLFSMSERFSPGGGGAFWVYWVTALPLVVIVLLVSALLHVWRPIDALGGWWERTFERWHAKTLPLAPWAEKEAPGR